MAQLWFESALLPGGWANAVRVTLQEGRIASVDAGAAPRQGDERHALAIPGLCNVHSHAFQRGMAGLTERRGGEGDDFWTWREVMYAFLGQLTPDDVEAIAAQAYVEMLEGGFTRVGEFHYLHHDASGAAYADPAEMAGRVASAAAHAGIGLTLLPVFYAHADFGGVPPNPGQRRFISTIGSFLTLIEASARHLGEDAILGGAFHSLRAASVEEIGAILECGLAGPIHIHVAEQMREVEACVAHHGARPVEWLLSNAPVNERWCLIHATHLTAPEIERLAISGAVAGLCPVTEANLGDGVFPTARFLALGGRMGVGTDSNVLINAAEELRALEYAQRLTTRTRCLLGDVQTPSVGRRLFEAACAGGAQALGALGGLAPGNSGDIVALDAAHPALAARSGDLALDSWLFAAKGGAVDSVWRGGVKVVSDGRHRNADAVARHYRATLARLLAK
ncbi:MAG: formimidoylglutamate deiminase [Caulobacteraceae bacterium]